MRKLRIIWSNRPYCTRIVDAESGEDLANVTDLSVSLDGRVGRAVVDLRLEGVEMVMATETSYLVQQIEHATECDVECDPAKEPPVSATPDYRSSRAWESR
jgi:hypothetical protein